LGEQDFMVATLIAKKAYDLTRYQLERDSRKSENNLRSSGQEPCPEEVLICPAFRFCSKACPTSLQEFQWTVLNLPWDACVHSARHTALTNLGLTGVDPFTLQRAAGHANITTTRKYVHPTPATMKDAFQKKVRNERRDRRATRKRAVRVATSPSTGEPLATDTVQ
jgi:integrase